MATRLQKIFWSLLAGAALGVSGCGDGGEPEYGAPVDTSTDEGTDTAAEVVEEPAVDPTEEEPMSTDYGPVADV
jgi:hypothetical protein